jgi:hypothetical protein
MILATTKVDNFDQFLKVFSTKGAEKRKQHGSKGCTVFRDPSEENRVGDLRLGRGGLGELRFRPGSPADHEGGRAPGQAASGDARRTLLRLTLPRGGCRAHQTRRARHARRVFHFARSSAGLWRWSGRNSAA